MMSDMRDVSHVFDLLPAYAIGSLETDEARQVEEHLLNCSICRHESHTFQTVATHLCLAVPPVKPSPDLKKRLIARIHGSKASQPVPAQSARRPRLDRKLAIWGLTSFVLILILGVFGLSLWQRVNDVEFATSPGGMRAVPLNGTEEVPGATGFVLVSMDGRNGALVVDGLPPLDASHEYQLWLVQDEQRISGAIFSTDEQNYGGTRIRAPGSLLEYQAVEITTEPAGGSKHPTGAAVLKGSLFNP
jgi:anti-sigma-K factor RskA